MKVMLWIQFIVKDSLTQFWLIAQHDAMSMFMCSIFLFAGFQSILGKLSLHKNQQNQKPTDTSASSQPIPPVTLYKCQSIHNTTITTELPITTVHYTLSSRLVL